MELKYKVDGQNVKAVHNIEPVAGSKGYLAMLFDYMDTAVSYTHLTLPTT